jgi:sarcosine oxidase
MIVANKNIFDVIIIGVGSMGSAACYELAKRGCKVLGIEQFTISHELGSHAGQSRIIRKAYFEHPDYVPLLQRAYNNWREIEKQTGEQLYFKTGLLYAGDKNNFMISGVKESALRYSIQLEKIASGSNRFGSFSFPSGTEILFEPDAGFVTPEKAIRLYAEQSKKYGAEIISGEKVVEWKIAGDAVVVKTGKEIYQAKKLVITAGAWAGKMIPGMNNNIKVTRQFVAWVKPKRPEKFLLNDFPCWMIADDKQPGCYYGFPMLPPEKFGPPQGLKLAHHHAATITDADNVNRETTNEDIDNLVYCLEKYLPGTFDGLLHSKVCLYANSPDENFIIDHLPGYEKNVSIACGFSGHGFKFVSVVGEILADLATDGKTSLPIDFLNAKRFF